MGCVRPPISVLVGVVLMALAFVLEVVGLAAPGWCSLWVGEKGVTMVGLWEFCYELPNFTCEDLENLWPIQSWLEGCRAMGVLAVLVQGACLTSVLLLSLFRRFHFFFAVAAWTALSSAMLIFTEFSIFVGAVEMKKNTMGRDFYYQYAFVLTIVAFVLSLLAAVAFFVGDARNRSSQKLKETETFFPQ
ncbi:uncharacterized protein LOC143291144 isoform X2 [Babylonia areolata]